MFHFLDSTFKIIIFFLAIITASCEQIGSAVAEEASIYRGLNFSDSKDTVWKKLGRPTQVALPPQNVDLQIDGKMVVKGAGMVMPATKKEIHAYPHRERDFNMWIYVNNGGALFLNFDNNSADLISLECSVVFKSEVKRDTCKIYNIKAFDSEDKVIRALGQPSVIEKTSTSTNLYYSDRDMMVVVDEDGVVNIKIRNRI
jgi:hypothetical protein